MLAQTLNFIDLCTGKHENIMPVPHYYITGSQKIFSVPYKDTKFDVDEPFVIRPRKWTDIFFMQPPFFQFIVFNIEQKESSVISFRFYNDSLTKKLIRASLQKIIDYVHTPPY